MCVSAQTLAVLTEAATLSESATFDEIMAAKECAAQSAAKVRFKLLCGTAHQMFCQQQKLSSNVVICDSGTHTCNETCSLLQVEFSVHQVAGAPNRVHVCLGVTNCTAPASCHAKTSEVVTGCLFVCSTSNVCHICTAEECTAERVTKDSYSCCVLTGKVLTRDAKILSNGWIEDEWRSGLACPSYDERCASPVPPLAPDPAVSPVPNTRRRSAQYRHLPGSALVSEWWRSIHNVCTARVDAVSPPGLAADEKQKWVVTELRAVAAASIRKLLPGSATHQEVKAFVQTRETARFTRAVEKYIRNRQLRNLPLCMQVLTQILATVTESKPRRLRQIELDESKACAISQGYAEAVVRFLHKLLHKTEFVRSEISFDDFVCATMYLQTTNFRVGNVSIFKPDPFLSLLPVASHLDAYGYKKSAFTNAKGAVQSAIFEALESGIDAGLLTFPTSSFSDLYL